MRNAVAGIILFSLLVMGAGCKESDNKKKNLELELLGLLSVCRQDGVISTAAGSGIRVSLSPADSWALYPGTDLTITATVSNDISGQGVTWSLINTGGTPGTLTAAGVPGTSSATYTASSPGLNNSAGIYTVTATSIADTTKTATIKVTIIPDSGTNVHSIVVDGGPPALGTNYPDGVFATITICDHNNPSNCDIVDHILVDTGSYGLRILASKIPNTLSAMTFETGSIGTVNNCAKFIDGTFLWGPVAPADVTLGNETASGTPIQLIQDPSGYSIPTACSGGGANSSTQSSLGSNGILGVGLAPQDCGSFCAVSASAGLYYECTGAGCIPAAESIARQVTNPVVNLAADNNGVIIALPSVPAGGAAKVTGSMIFGIGTRTNNALGSAAVYTVNQNGNFTTIFNCRTLSSSFIDSGSNGLFFNSSIPGCIDAAAGFYCPAVLLNFLAVNIGVNGTKGTVNFSIGNTGALFGTGDAAFSDLGGLGFSGGFDWGLPFFFGRSVYSAIAGQPTPGGNGPYWAY